MEEKEAFDILWECYGENDIMGREVTEAWQTLKSAVLVQLANNTARAEICPVCTGDGIGADTSGWVKCPTCNGAGKLSPVA
jgi:DnaJ-class molecular chaperone